MARSQVLVGGAPAEVERLGGAEEGRGGGGEEGGGGLGAAAGVGEGVAEARAERGPVRAELDGQGVEDGRAVEGERRLGAGGGLQRVLGGPRPLAGALPVRGQHLVIVGRALRERDREAAVGVAAILRGEARRDRLPHPVVVGLDAVRPAAPGGAHQARRAEGLHVAASGSRIQLRRARRDGLGEQPARERDHGEEAERGRVEDPAAIPERLVQPERGGRVRAGVEAVEGELLEKEGVAAGLVGERPGVGARAHELLGEGARLGPGQRRQREDTEAGGGAVLGHAAQEVLGPGAVAGARGEGDERRRGPRLAEDLAGGGRARRRRPTGGRR